MDFQSFLKKLHLQSDEPATPIDYTVLTKDNLAELQQLTDHVDFYLEMPTPNYHTSAFAGFAIGADGHWYISRNVELLMQPTVADLLSSTTIAKDEAAIEAQPCTFRQAGIVLAEACDVRNLPGFAEGWISVQDEAAQLAADLLDLAPGQRVLDACCAPGGKTCHILEVEPKLAGVVAVDLEAKRLVRVRENLERLGLSAELIAADGRDTATWWDGKPFQRILLDAPCSATGVIRRHPDIKLTRQPDDIAALATLQGELLDAMWPTLDVGGILLYATCSTLPTENTEVIEAFLARTPGARELDIAGQFGLKQPHGRQLLAQQGGHDGFYYAKLIKIAAARG